MCVSFPRGNSVADLLLVAINSSSNEAKRESIIFSVSLRSVLDYKQIKPIIGMQIACLWHSAVGLCKLLHIQDFCARSKTTVVSCVSEQLKAPLLHRSGSKGLWFNPHPRHLGAFLDKALYDAYLCLVEHKQQITCTRFYVTTWTLEVESSSGAEDLTSNM